MQRLPKCYTWSVHSAHPVLDTLPPLPPYSLSRGCVTLLRSLVPRSGFLFRRRSWGPQRVSAERAEDSEARGGTNRYGQCQDEKGGRSLHAKAAIRSTRGRPHLNSWAGRYNAARVEREQLPKVGPACLIDAEGSRDLWQFHRLVLFCGVGGIWWCLRL